MARRKLTSLVLFGIGALCVLGIEAFAQTPAEVATAKEKALAVGAGDLNGDGVTDVQDLDILISNLGLSADATPNQGDLDLDKDVDNDDLAELLSLLSSTIDINSRLIIDRLVEKGLIAFSDPWTVHPQHNAPFSGSGHQKQWSHTHPNHELTVSREWGNPDLHNLPIHDLTRSGAWPPNHTLTLSSTWNHGTSWSGTWPPRHNQLMSSLWPQDHLQLVSKRWPPLHVLSNSTNTTNPRPNEDHHTTFSDGWAPTHELTASRKQWPPNQILSISQEWNPRPASHSVAQSRMWPPNHFSAVRIGWPNADNPWPPNHFKTITEGPTTPPAGQ